MARLTADLLTSCLDEVLDGRVTAETCVKEHPAEAEELRGFLELAQAIVPPTVPTLDPAARRLGRAALLESITAPKVPVTKRLVQRFLGAVDPFASSGRTLRAVGLPLIALLIVAIALSFGGGVALAAQNTLPGDTFYWVKTGLEDMSVTFAPGPAARARVYLELAARRLDEIDRADRVGRSGAVLAAARAFRQDLVLADDARRQAIATGLAANQVNASFVSILRTLQTRAGTIRARVGPGDPSIAEVVQALDQSLADVRGVPGSAASTQTALRTPAGGASSPAPGADPVQSPLPSETPTVNGPAVPPAISAEPTTGASPAPVVSTPPGLPDTATPFIVEPSATSIAPTPPAIPSPAKTMAPLPTVASPPSSVPIANPVPPSSPPVTPVPTARPTSDPIPTVPPVPTAIPTTIPISTVPPLPTARPTSIPVPTVPPRPTAVPTVPPPPTALPTVPPLPTELPTLPTPRPPVAIPTQAQVPTWVRPVPTRLVGGL